MVKRNISVILTLILLVFLAVLIFSFSAQTAETSSGLSREVTRFLLRVFSPGFKTLDPAAQAKLITAAHKTVRKLAHFTEYALLGAVLALHLRLVLKMKARYIWLSAFILGTFYAVLDEWHQSFVSGRAMQIADMLLDSGGVLCGIALAAFVLFLFAGRRRRHEY